MGYLFKEIDRVKKALTAPNLYLFLDYDGTLTPIRKNPDRAVLSDTTREILRKLSENPRNKVAIISGRSLQDIKNMVGLKGVIYVGNHGLEIEGPKINFKYPLTTAFLDIHEKLKKKLAQGLSEIKGAIVEDKGLTLSVHFRKVKKESEPLVKNVFYGIVRPYLDRKEMRATFGKKVFEIRPAIRWDKGKAVLWLLARQQFALKGKVPMAIYIGDDVTDEDAFKVLRNRALTVFVGSPKKSGALYYLKNINEVKNLLRRIVKSQRT